MTTPAHRIKRLLDEGAIFRVQIPGEASIDLTPDIIAIINEAQTSSQGFKYDKESIEPN